MRSLWIDPHGDVYAVLTVGAQEFPVCAACQKKGFLRVGSTLLGAYRIEQVTRDEIALTYLPMKRRQSISLGGGK
ncbi:hypothetical protein [Cupriavidus plantarum]|uniref:hypothetical protein n=1 Tax=Cupriavidus plantarum TaxID=942865 RepID=UPI000D6C96E9|nr:hypothetical protein [Cupriavidus plantarum]